MTQPTPFNPSTDYSQYAADHPNAPFSAEGLDVDLAAVALTTSELITNIGLIQRDDGKLANESVGVDTIDSALKLLIAAGNDDLADNIRGSWLTATAYSKADIVTSSNVTYLCMVNHTSGVLATDVAAGKWAVLFNNGTASASGVSFSPTGSVAATNVQNAIAEVDSEKLAKSANLSDLTALQTARDNLQVPSKSTIQLQFYTYFADTGTADAMVATPTPAIATGYTNGLKLDIKVLNDNATTAPTLNVSGLGAKTCFYPNGNQLLPSDLVANRIYSFEYNSSLNSGAGGWGVYGVSETSPGTSGTVLTSNGPGAAKSWKTPFKSATQAEVLAAAADDVGVSPARALYLPGYAKAGILFTISGGTPVAADTYNMSSTITDNGAGDYTLTFTRAFVDTNYRYEISTEGTTTVVRPASVRSGGKATGSIRIIVNDMSGSLTDPASVSLHVYGTLA